MAEATGREQDRPARWRNLAPGWTVLRHYPRRWLRGDVVAGVTVAAYLVPQVMAYATVAGLPPVVGLWACLAPLVAYAFLGSSRQLSVGPESTTALLTAVAIAPLAAGDAGRYAALAAALALIVGVLFVLAWVARVGFVADLLSRPILVGYLTGVALTMILSQAGAVTGTELDGDTPLTEALALVAAMEDVNWSTVLLSAAVLAFLAFAQRYAPRIPGPLAAVVLASVAVAVFDLQDRGVAVVGAMPTGLPAPSLPSVGPGDLGSLVLPALGVVLVGYSDSITTARAFAHRRHEQVDANTELLALGAANLGSGLSSGFPVSSSASRTALGAVSGSRTQLHSLVTAGCVVVVLAFLAPLLAYFPTAALGALVIYAALRLIDIGELARFAAFRRSELVIALVTTAGVLVLDILQGLLVAITLSAALMLARVARPHSAVLGKVPGLAGMHDVGDFAGSRTIPGLVVFRYDSPLFFANADDFRRHALEAVETAEGPVRWFLLNAEANVDVDITALDAMEELRRELVENGVVVALARVKQELLADLRAHGLAARVGEDRIYPTLPTAVEGYERWCRETVPDPSDGDEP